jgi:preprotein translocase subunit YajC
MIVLFALLWFLLIRPQQKRAKEHRNMVNALSKDDEVVTSGGILGRITHLDENFVRLEVAENTEVSVQRHSVASLMPKGTMKTEGAGNKTRQK